MKYLFNLPDFPDSSFVMQITFWTGKQILFKNGALVEQSGEKGKPFLIPDENETVVKAYPKPSLPDFAPILIINGEKHRIVAKLPWYQLVLALLPLLLLYGGALGGGAGAIAAMLNMQVFRNEDSAAVKYFKVIGITIAAFAVYFLLVRVIYSAIA
ncbi:hypothetical protein D3C87_400250 [compost metagenome]